MPHWLLLLLIIIIFFIIIRYARNNRSEKKKLDEIREQWGKVKNTDRNFKLIAAYLTGKNESNIPENTATDLDTDSLFKYIDRTSSGPGQQYLYKKLHSSHFSEAHFKTLEQSITAINQDQDLRSRAQLKLSSLSNTDAYYLPQLFGKPQQTIFTSLLTIYVIIAPFLTVWLILSLFIVPNQFAFLLVFIMVITNVTIHYVNKFKMLSYTHSLPQLLILYNVAKWLAGNNLLIEDEAVNTSLTNVGKLKKSLGFINIQNKIDRDPTDIAYLISEWLKMFLVIEPLIFIYSINHVNKYLDDIKTLYEAVAGTDMAISIQSVRDGAPHFCKPHFLPEGDNIIIKDLYHPLIANCITNSISIDNKQGVLVTGSNMSGKTTFIRAVATNALLSQSINTSFATEYSAPPLKILTSIDINDDLGDGKSYFQVEALSVKNIIKLVADSKPVNSLVIIDEIFRGTNTIERIAAAKAVLTYLINNRSFVFVSTHDLELAELLGEDYKVFSFEELAGDSQLVFDYKIKEGLLKNRNGIAVLKGLEFPDSIINEANKLSIQLRNKYDL